MARAKNRIFSTPAPPKRVPVLQQIRAAQRRVRTEAQKLLAVNQPDNTLKNMTDSELLQAYQALRMEAIRKGLPNVVDITERDERSRLGRKNTAETIRAARKDADKKKATDEDRRKYIESRQKLINDILRLVNALNPQNDIEGAKELGDIDSPIQGKDLYYALQFLYDLIPETAWKDVRNIPSDVIRRMAALVLTGMDPMQVKDMSKREVDEAYRKRTKGIEEQETQESMP